VKTEELRFSASMASNQECHICLEELRQDLVAAPCGHVFHETCILQALQVNQQCPLCRRRTGEADIITLYFDVPGLTDAPTVQEPSSQGSGDSVALSSRINKLMQRVEWQNKCQDQLMDELRRLRTQSEQLIADKQTLAQRVGGLESVKTDLLTKVARYQMELSRQSEVIRRSSVNQSIMKYLETCDASAMEEEIQNPRELIMALKKACKFRHDQYQKVVKEKLRLKEMLKSSQHQTVNGSRGGKPKGRAASTVFESKHAYPPPGEFGTGIQPQVMESKKRKVDMVSTPMPYFDQQGSDVLGFTPRSESAGFRANAYSDVSIRPPPPSRQTFGRSNMNPNQYGAFNLVPSSQPLVQMAGQQAAVCRRGYDETGKLTNFFLPKEGESRAMPRKKPIPSMQNLLNLNSQPRASGQQQRVANSDRQEYVLTNWLRNN
jgi:TRAF-interacting protein